MNLDFVNIFHTLLTSSQSTQEKRPKLLRVCENIIDSAVADEQVSFTSLFAKLSFLCEKYDLSGFERYELHYLRKLIHDPSKNSKNEVTHLLTYLIPQLLKKCLNIDIPDELKDLVPKQSGVAFEKRPISGYFPTVKFYCIAVDKNIGMMIGFSEDNPTEKVKVDYKLQDRNIRFAQNVEEITQLPILMMLLEVEIAIDGIYRPSTIIIEPDYLLDATAVANCFNGSDQSYISYILRKFLPMSRSKPLLIGNIANYFLDRLIQEPSLNFNDILPELFAIDPLGFTVLKDEEVKGFVKDLQMHFINISHTVNQTLATANIDSAKVYLEPSFISPDYGLQGRLDLLMPDKKQPKIIELKSGSIYKPNAYGVNSPHYIQTLMYDLLIRSTFKGVDPKNYILYSKEKKQSLRLAPRIVAQQKEALQVRNHLLSIENEIGLVNEKAGFFEMINTNKYADAKGFEMRNIETFEKVWSGLDTTEKAYFKAFSAFIAREHKLSKIGEYGQDKRNGLAGLWLDSTEEKCEQFVMLKMLEIEENNADKDQALIKLKHSEFTNEISNFRQGDILVLYPMGKGTASPQQNQIFKCNVIEIQPKSITISLRGIQKNFQIFEENQYWALEHDTMDTSFTNMYRQLFLWAGAPKVKRELTIGRRIPEKSQVNQQVQLDSEAYEFLTNNQKEVLSQMIQSSDYYLVWGPPGTGKTSVLICKYIQYLMDHTDENLYVLAYTNRAVDELCAAIESLGDKYVQMYVRVGSAYGANERYIPNLLRSKIKGITRRNALKEKIKSHRMVVGTIASLASRQMIYELIPPKRLIVDEASQILEPNIVGLLTLFEQFVLVGDHKQLPAVVVQSDDQSANHNEELKAIGLQNRRNSLFERLYARAIATTKTNLYGQLKMQARMHEAIMKFPNEQFYQGELKVLPKISRLVDKDKSILPRLGFVQADVPDIEAFSKTNHAEIAALIHVIPKFLDLGFKPKEIGIITPFRAQIAAIQKSIQSELEGSDEISIDTVERYQGSAKKIILISFCCNSVIQFSHVQSLDENRVDRKLNVALTRAKEHLILIGDDRILGTNALYKELIDSCERMN